MAKPIEDLPNEIWKPVLGYEGSYEVSNMGRVKSLPRVVKRRDGWTQRLPGCLLSPGDTQGYEQVSLRRNGNSRSFRVHRLVLEAFVCPRPFRADSCHNNGNRKDNRLENLRWGTRSENEYDKIVHGSRRMGPREAALWNQQAIVHDVLTMLATRRGEDGNLCRALLDFMQPNALPQTEARVRALLARAQEQMPTGA